MCPRSWAAVGRPDFRTKSKIMKKKYFGQKTAISARYINVYGKNKLTFPSSFQIAAPGFSLYLSYFIFFLFYQIGGRVGWRNLGFGEIRGDFYLSSAVKMSDDPPCQNKTFANLNIIAYS